MPTSPDELVKTVQAERKKKQKKNVTFRIENALIERLSGYCDKKEISMTQLLEEFLRTLPEVSEKKSTKR